jgi:hypothetical protein
MSEANADNVIATANTVETNTLRIVMILVSFEHF